MSIIVYDGITLVIDSAAIHEGVKIPLVKHWSVDEQCVIVTGVGNAAQISLMRDWFMAGADPDKFPKSQALGSPWCELIVVNHRGLVRYENTPSPVEHGRNKCAFGSGKDFAYGALAVGATAEQAVTAALQYSPECGHELLSFQWRYEDEEIKTKSRLN